MIRQATVGWAVFLSAAGAISKGGEQENDFLYAIIAFNKFQENVPDALYIDGGDEKEPVKIENIQILTPYLAIVCLGVSASAALRVEPIQMARENLDGAPADSYLVDLATIEPDRMASIDVRWTEEVENNLENFAEKCFLDLVFQQKQVFATGVSQVLKAVADGEDYPTYFREPLITQYGGYPFFGG